ncbi:glycine cleavage T C-terminal barrel domain-containing protein [Arthrobacter oryzae]|uniref:Glycine cleavage system protein T n=1 Tax=Arthrobacter oryzae TaxID=409290 RepID=A0A3N0CIX7_9MICC|nr:glycine cleavage T C-terminal barrel domain-containing protein [Arthrobacter oryzae]RNL63428.1 glycine cleavage system protein T [Arthrobacter oryzae]
MTSSEQGAMLLYPRIRKSPYFWAAREHGVAMYSVYNRMYIPRHFGDPVAEYWNLLNNVNITDVGVERAIEITGPDAFTFTNMLVTRDLTKCEVGQCKYTFITDASGGIINDPVLLRLGQNHFWLTLADSDALLWAKGLAVNSGLDVQIGEPDMGPLQVQGPKSLPLMVDLFGEGIREIGYYYFREFEFEGTRVLVSRTGYSAELGYEIYAFDGTKNGTKLWNAVIEAGKPYGLAPAGVCHLRRIEAGILALGADIDLSTNPYEVGMGYPWMVNLDKEGGFVGADALRKIRDDGVKRQLAGLLIEGEPLGTYNDGSMIDSFEVTSEGTLVGKVTSACFSPRLEQNIGMAMLPVELITVGTSLRVNVDGIFRDATVTEMPFVDSKKETPKQAVAASAGT